ncbi:hypothetical protein MA16_Dca017417 [Dendrobium catenatum]|uniref:Uncharacterized protein n=1 Tax=Dendrobium catenatum TaxID=906689 RepID=A0A2I0X0E7_9ASPA|nr:hypothetical protein MA16_Dca017417 [Dendrobium catenatum]
MALGKVIGQTYNNHSAKTIGLALKISRINARDIANKSQVTTRVVVGCCSLLKSKLTAHAAHQQKRLKDEKLERLSLQQTWEIDAFD